MNPEGQDRRIFSELIESLDGKKRCDAISTGELMLEVGRAFLGRPYAAGTLETDKDERLVTNLREVDCFTFVENVVVLARLLKSGNRSFKAYRRLLQKVRYRGGRLRGYSSRLHYFSDWILDNQKKRILKNITAEIGGKPLRKAITFMTTHRALYPALRNASDLRKMKSVEKSLSKRPLFYLPKKSFRRWEGFIDNGHLIAVTTGREGLDVQHAGIAVRLNRRIHLLHASSREGKVILSKETLYRYLMQGRDRSGVMIARVSFAVEKESP